MNIEQFCDCFSIDGRRLSKKEKGYIDKWFNICGYEFPTVEKAYMTTIYNIGRASFSYTDKILSHWRELSKNT